MKWPISSRMSKFTALSLLPLIGVVTAFQNCAPFSTMKSQLEGSSSAASSSITGRSILNGANVVGQQFEVMSSGTITQVALTWPAPPTNRMRQNEAPPLVIKGGAFGYVLTTGETSNCWSNYSLTTQSAIALNCNDVNTSTLLTALANGAADTDASPWTRNYNGIMGAHAVNDPVHGQILLTIHHGENLNQIAVFPNKTVTMQNSISQVPAEQVANCWANYTGTSSASPLDCYWGFISAGWIEYDAASSWGSKGEASTIGPITWPAAGYVDANGISVSRGVRHPSSIIDNGYIYVFYLDSSLADQRGIRIIRAPVGTALTSSAWERLDGGVFKQGTLPTGFQIVNNRIDSSFYKMKSPNMDFAFPPAERADRFAVARMVGGGYIGVETGLDANGLGEVGIRTSSDLIHWSARTLVTLPGYNTGGSSFIGPAYSLLLSADGASNNDIDPGSFFIYGTVWGSSSLVRIPMHVVGGPLPSPAIRLGVINAGTPITCDQFNPIAAQSLSNDDISWLATQQTSGITLHENYMLARQNGYTGAFGNGEHASWLSLDASRSTAFNSAVSTLANTATPPWATWTAHNLARKAAGYQGLFLCGGDACFQAGNCDAYGRALPGVSLATAMAAAATPTPTPAPVADISYGFIKAGVPIVCDYFSPTAIKSLSTETIQWLASLQPSGITLHENYIVARQQGYTGAFGTGDHNTWLAADSNRQAAFAAAVNAYAAQPSAPWATWAAHNQARRAAGYQGLFLCGGDACFQAGQCDALGRAL